jgi:hypothetical protein
MPRRYTPKVIVCIVAAVALSGTVACGAKSDSAAEKAPAQPAATAGDRANASAGDPAPDRTADPERADKIADLDRLCAALNEDYVDGTLSDYFKGLTMKTQWGADVMAKGNDADQPGRFLETTIETLSPKAADPGLPACRKLLDYIDEVE